MTQGEYTLFRVTREWIGQDGSLWVTLWMEPGTGVLYRARAALTALRVAGAAAVFPVCCVISRRGSGSGCVSHSVYRAVATSSGLDSEHWEELGEQLAMTA